MDIERIELVDKNTTTIVITAFHMFKKPEESQINITWNSYSGSRNVNPKMSKIMWSSEAWFENYCSRILEATENFSAKLDMKIVIFLED